MSDTTGNECPVTVFCGGDHVRLGRLAGAQAKTLLVAHDTPLLWRLLDQLRAAGFLSIVAATTPRLEGQISDSVDRYARTTARDASIRVVATADQQRGVLFGLRGVLGTWSANRCVTCLGDMFFLENPFLSLRDHVGASYDCLGVAPTAVDEELKHGGIVYEQGGSIRSVLERPVAVVTGRPLRWSGIALFERGPTQAELEVFATGSADDSPFGDFFEFERRRGRDLRSVAGPDFVNVNSPDHLLLASLYARLEADPGPSSLSATLTDAASALRLDLARRAPGKRSR